MKRMRIKILVPVCLFVLMLQASAQQPPVNALRVVDTLTAEEKTGRNPVILRSELDSLFRLEQDQRPVQQLTDPGQGEEKAEASLIVLISLLLLLVAMVAILMYQLFRQQRAIKGLAVSRGMNRESGMAGKMKERNGKLKPAISSTENNISDLQAELLRLSRENEGMNRVIREYNGIHGELDALRHGILKTYKIKNYPGYDPSKDETALLQGIFDTEDSVARYAFEKFLKPVLAIADKHKNNPAKISIQDRQEMMNLLLSLSFLYIEYLYLRVKDLSIGGKMVERIRGFAGGNGIDPGLLKALNTEAGNRALVMKMVLNAYALQQLHYPVFDETNLNNI